jgi:hypothetical protein
LRLVVFEHAADAFFVRPFLKTSSLSSLY